MNNQWIEGTVLVFAGMGIWTSIRYVTSGWRKFVETLNELTGTLKDAAEIAKAYREDVQILKQIAQSAPGPNFGEEPESIIPKTEQYGSRMPEPYLGRFPTKPVEPEAPVESLREVDVTATDEEFVEQEKNEAALDLEAQERQKAATRNADQERLKELADLSGDPK